jgi:hypothetical protein
MSIYLGSGVSQVLGDSVVPQCNLPEKWALIQVNMREKPSAELSLNLLPFCLDVLRCYCLMLINAYIPANPKRAWGVKAES